MEEIKIIQNASLSFNFENAKAELEAKVEPYRNLVFTEDSKKDAKETVAQLRKEQKELGEQIKSIKKEYMKPFEEFSAKAMELVSLYDEPIGFINGQVQAFEEQRKEEKKRLIVDIYTEMMATDEDIKAFLPLGLIYNSKWENATATKKQIAEEIMTHKLNAKTAISTICSMKSDKEAEALAMYKRNFNLSECILFINQYEQQKAEILRQQEEKARQEELERVRAEERAKIEAEAQKEAEIAQAVETAQAEAIEAFIPNVEAESKPYTYIIELSEDAKNKLERFMDSVGIEYEQMMF